MTLGNYHVEPLLTGEVIILSAYAPLSGLYTDEITFLKAKEASDRNRLLSSLSFCFEKVNTAINYGMRGVTGDHWRLLQSCRRDMADMAHLPNVAIQPTLNNMIYALRPFTRVLYGMSQSITGHFELISDYYQQYCKVHESFNDKESAR